MTPRPAPTIVCVENIPEEMRRERRWVNWRYEWREAKNGKKAKWTKPPYLTPHCDWKCGITDPANWHTFEETLAAHEDHVRRGDGKSDGIGFVLGDGWVGFDQDGTDALEHALTLNSYTERSPSGKGLHTICHGAKPDGKCRKGPYELYDSGRYFTVTGQHIEGTPRTVEPRQAEIAALHAELLVADTPPPAPPPSDAVPATTLDDETVLKLALGAKSGKKFKSLWDNEVEKNPDLAGKYDSWSEKDLALCVRLAVWTNRNAVQMDRLFRLSKLFRKEKWDEKHGGQTYGEKTIASAIAFCKTTYTPAGASIIMRGGDLTEIVNRAETALLTGPVPIYQRGGLLTRVVKLDTATDEQAPVRREIGSTVLIPVRDPWLVEQMSRTAQWLKVSAKGNYSPADPDPKYARTLLARNQWRFPVLRGVVTAPTLDRDGRIIEAPGYDRNSGLLLDFAPGSFPPVPLHPTKEQARAALARLAYPLRKFPFVSAADKAVALSAMLTAVIRRSLRTSPLHGFDAPVAGTGKSLLAEVVGLLATGFLPPSLSQGKSAEEDEKRLSTVLFAGDPVIHIDNCERDITGDFLCSMLTQEVVQARILGLSERRILPSTALVLASGNNLAFAGDTSRRAFICRLDAKTEQPDQREFDFDCRAVVRDQRPQLVIDALTVLRAYVVAGKPAQKVKVMGSFEDMQWVRGALVWLGEADPADTRTRILAGDPRRSELVEVMDLWDEVFGHEHVTMATISTQDKKSKPEAPATPADALRAKLSEVANCKGGWNGKSVGWWLRRHKDRMNHERCFRGEDQGGRQVWWLEGATPEQGVLPTEDEEVPF